MGCVSVAWPPSLMGYQHNGPIIRCVRALEYQPLSYLLSSGHVGLNGLPDRHTHTQCWLCDVDAVWQEILTILLLHL